MKVYWKILSVLLIVYSLVAGLLGDVPRLPILNETIRNLYYHVPMWFAMIGMFLMSFIHSIRYLSSQKMAHQDWAYAYARTGVVLGLLGMVTGMIWANYTWGSPWHGDPKQNAAAISLFIYFAYFILYHSLDNVKQKAQFSSVYNIFAFASMIPLLFILPRMTSSMHPGNGGNPGFNMYDVDARMRLVFYPAVIGWMLFGAWLTDVTYRVSSLLKTQKSIA